MYYFQLLLIISFRLITSLIPIFVPSSIKLTFFRITSMTIHPSNAFFQFSIFFFFINNCLKVFMTNFIIYQCFRYFTFMLFNLLLASITILLCFLFLFLVLKNFFTNSEVIENVRPQLAPIILAGASITVANDAVEMLPDNADKTFNDLSK